MSNSNILEIIRIRPLNLVMILIYATRGIWRRRLGAYSQIKIDPRIKELNLSMGKVKLRPIEHEIGNWKKAFKINLSNDFKWSLKRDHFLEDFFKELVEIGDVPRMADDKENFWSAVQLNWLFYSVRTGFKGADESQAIILECCKLLQKNRGDWLYRTFTVSEVISNIIKIKLFFGDDLKINDEIEEFLVNGIEYITENLEIYSLSNKVSLNHTNNHILSNTRALFWASKACNNDEILKLAEYLYKTTCLQLFCKGNLDEGSTTYHMIAAQCIFDISFFVPHEILPRIDLMIFDLEKKGYLKPETFPFIGDISPDPSLASVIDDSLNISTLISKSSQINKLDLPNDDLQPSSDFEHHKANNWQFILHTRKGYKHIQHSHNDYGSPVLMYQDSTIICDLGRTSYSKKVDQPDLTSTSYHSVPQIENLEQNPRGARDVYPHQYLTPIVQNIEIEDCPFDKLQVSRKSSYNLICAKEYNLLADKLLNGSWFRFFGVSSVSDDEFIIEDVVNTDGDKDVFFRFFIPERTHEDSLCTFEFSLNGVRVLPSISEVPCSRFYGDNSKAYCYKVSAASSHQYHLVTQIRIE